MPGMKATGTKTESRTMVMAMIGAVISPIAFRVASLAERPGSSSITRSTFSTTMMASSTTMPIARTRARSDTMFALYPTRSSTAKVPTIDTGTARSEEHTSELQSLMRISYAVFCLKKKKQHEYQYTTAPNSQTQYN